MSTFNRLQTENIPKNLNFCTQFCFIYHEHAETKIKQLHVFFNKKTQVYYFTKHSNNSVLKTIKA